MIKKEFEQIENEKKRLKKNITKLEKKQNQHNLELDIIQKKNTKLEKGMGNLTKEMQIQKENNLKAEFEAIKVQEELRRKAKFEKERYETLLKQQRQIEENKKKQQERRQRNLEELKQEKKSLEQKAKKLQVLDHLIEEENATWFPWFSKAKVFHRSFNQMIRNYEILGYHPDCIEILKGGVGYNHVDVKLKGHFLSGYTKVRFYGHYGESEAYKYQLKSLNQKIDNLYLVITFDK